MNVRGVKMSIVRSKLRFLTDDLCEAIASDQEGYFDSDAHEAAREAEVHSGSDECQEEILNRVRAILERYDEYTEDRDSGLNELDFE